LSKAQNQIVTSEGTLNIILVGVIIKTYNSLTSVAFIFIAVDWYASALINATNMSKGLH
jgi:hypothetical protein